MKSKVRFDYSRQAVLFLEERIDENVAYANAINVFEDLIARYPKIGDPIDKPPIVIRRLPIKIPKLRDLAFYYILKGKTVEVFQMEFADETPL